VLQNIYCCSDKFVLCISELKQLIIVLPYISVLVFTLFMLLMSVLESDSPS